MCVCVSECARAHARTLFGELVSASKRTPTQGEEFKYKWNHADRVSGSCDCSRFTVCVTKGEARKWPHPPCSPRRESNHPFLYLYKWLHPNKSEGSSAQRGCSLCHCSFNHGLSILVCLCVSSDFPLLVCLYWPLSKVEAPIVKYELIPIKVMVHPKLDTNALQRGQKLKGVICCCFFKFTLPFLCLFFCYFLWRVQFHLVEQNIEHVS